MTRAALAAALVAAAAVAAVSPASAAEPGIERPIDAAPVRIRVVLTPMVDEDQRAEFDAALREQLPELAAVNGFVVSEPGDAELTVRVQLMPPEEDADLYMISSTAMFYGEFELAPERACLQCTPSEAVADALTSLVGLAPRVVACRPLPAPADERAPLPEPPVDQQPRARRWLGPVGYLGIGAAALGLGGVIAGAVLLDRGVVVEDVGMTTIELADYRRPGAALLGVGLGLLVIGNVALGVDLGVLANRRRARTLARLDGVAPIFGPQVGFVLAGRF